MTNTDRRLTATDDGRVSAGEALRHPHPASFGMVNRLSRPHSLEEAEERYVIARDTWTAAMRAANSGRSTDLAALAIVQEAYEKALAERERWASSPSVPISIGDDRPSGLEAVVGQELSRRRVREHEREQELARERPRGLRGLVRRITRR